MLLLFLHPAVPLSLRAQLSQSHSVTDAHLKVCNRVKKCLFTVYLSESQISHHQGHSAMDLIRLIAAVHPCQQSAPSVHPSPSSQTTGQ